MRLTPSGKVLEALCVTHEQCRACYLIAVEGAATAVRGPVEIRIPLLGLIDVAEELARLDKELARVEGDIKYVTGKLGNARFVDNAPEAIVQKERDKHTQYLEEQAALMAARKDLEALAGGE